MNSGPQLPSFARPPLNEVVVSVQFESITGMHPAHMGHLWDRFRKHFPKVQYHPPIDPAVERIGARVPFTATASIVEGYPPPRLWFLSDSETDLIQVQQDRFIRNWRQLKSENVYPRFSAHIRPKFIEDLKQFASFLSDEGLGSIKANQCEVTYINHIESGEVWKTHEEFSKVFTGIQPTLLKDSGLFLEDAKFALRQLIKNSNGQFLGRLHISAEPAFRMRDQRPIYVLTLVARGQPFGDAQDSVDSIMHFIDVGRDLIVRSFTEITSVELHALWGREDALH